MIGEKQIGSCPSCASMNTIKFDCDRAHIIEREDRPDNTDVLFYTGTCLHCGCAIREEYYLSYKGTFVNVTDEQMTEMLNGANNT